MKECQQQHKRAAVIKHAQDVEMNYRTETTNVQLSIKLVRDAEKLVTMVEYVAQKQQKHLKHTTIENIDMNSSTLLKM